MDQSLIREASIALLSQRGKEMGAWEMVVVAFWWQHLADWIFLLFHHIRNFQWISAHETFCQGVSFPSRGFRSVRWKPKCVCENQHVSRVQDMIRVQEIKLSWQAKVEWILTSQDCWSLYEDTIEAYMLAWAPAKTKWKLSLTRCFTDLYTIDFLAMSLEL